MAIIPCTPRHASDSLIASERTHDCARPNSTISIRLHSSVLIERFEKFSWFDRQFAIVRSTCSSNLPANSAAILSSCRREQRPRCRSRPGLVCSLREYLLSLQPRPSLPLPSALAMPKEWRQRHSRGPKTEGQRGGRASTSLRSWKNARYDGLVLQTHQETRRRPFTPSLLSSTSPPPPPARRPTREPHRATESKAKSRVTTKSSRRGRARER